MKAIEFARPIIFEVYYPQRAARPICFQIWELEGRAKLPRYRSRDEYSRQKGRNVCEKLQTVDEYPVIWADNAELTVRENKTNENNAMFGVRNANTRMENYLLFAYSQ